MSSNFNTISIVDRLSRKTETIPLIDLSPRLLRALAAWLDLPFEGNIKTNLKKVLSSTDLMTEMSAIFSIDFAGTCSVELFLGEHLSSTQIKYAKSLLDGNVFHKPTAKLHFVGRKQSFQSIALPVGFRPEYMVIVFDNVINPSDVMKFKL